MRADGLSWIRHSGAGKNPSVGRALRHLGVSEAEHRIQNISQMGAENEAEICLLCIFVLFWSWSPLWIINSLRPLPSSALPHQLVKDAFSVAVRSRSKGQQHFACSLNHFLGSSAHFTLVPFSSFCLENANEAYFDLKWKKILNCLIGFSTIDCFSALKEDFEGSVWGCWKFSFLLFLNEEVSRDGDYVYYWKSVIKWLKAADTVATLFFFSFHLLLEMFAFISSRTGYLKQLKFSFKCKRGLYK